MASRRPGNRALTGTDWFSLSVIPMHCWLSGVPMAPLIKMIALAAVSIVVPVFGVSSGPTY